MQHPETTNSARVKLLSSTTVRYAKTVHMPRASSVARAPDAAHQPSRSMPRLGSVVTDSPPGARRLLWDGGEERVHNCPVHIMQRLPNDALELVGATRARPTRVSKFTTTVSPRRTAYKLRQVGPSLRYDRANHGRRCRRQSRRARPAAEARWPALPLSACTAQMDSARPRRP